MIFEIGIETPFPPVEFAQHNGLLAVGGDLSPARLISAYSSGIFPWFNSDDPILWWSPDPRFVIFPEETVYSKSMRKILRDEIFSITADQCFEQVIGECSEMKRRNQPGTWITTDMTEAYITLHRMGYAHSFEAWQNGELAGGLYGVSLGGIFFGESMFSKKSNASKTAFLSMVRFIRSLNFNLIDSQVYTAHLESLGARMIPRDEYLAILKSSLEYRTHKGSWSHMYEDFAKTDG